MELLSELFLHKVMIKIQRADIQHLSDLTPLFDQYRVFYQQASDLEGARAFLKKRLNNKESVVFIAYEDEQAIGFTQLFTTFSSVSMQAFFILNDLFVSPDFRKKGVGELLLNEAKSFCKLMNYKGLALETASDNPAQQLYERLNWKKDSAFYHYFWTAP